ncbi:MAG: hypothetical protein L0H94_05510 [Nitrospira sp.]|nr:hypothetical protein [Nitrospira sp.]
MVPFLQLPICSGIKASVKKTGRIHECAFSEVTIQMVRFIATRWSSSILLVLLCWPAFAQAPQPPTGQYIRIELPGVERTLSLAEVRVYSGEKNIAPHGKPTQVSTFADAVAARAIDGNSAGGYFGRSVTSTATQVNPWWELDLGSEKLITKIVFHNRTDCCSDRINPARILILDKVREVVWEGVIKTTENQYEFIPSTSDVSPSPNLLRNSNFQQRTNHSIPDYWDLHHVAALTLKDLHDQYGIDDNIESPVLNTKVLKIKNSEDNFPYLNLMPRKFFSTVPDGEYTFSAYLKADRNDMEYKVTRAWAEGEPVIRKLTTRWERYSATFRISNKNSDTLQPIMFFPSNGTYYITAPQLERGKKPSLFQPSLDDAVSETSATSLKHQLKNLLDSMSKIDLQDKQPLLSAAFEYDYYTSQQTAHLTLTSQRDSEMKTLIQCVNSAHTLVSLPMQSEIVIRPSSSTGIDVPIADMPLGNYTCLVEAVEGNTKQAVARANLTKLRASPFEVRINNLRRSMSINDKPFHIIGMGVGSWKTPPDWYFKDLAAHGINTVFYTHPPNVRGEYDVRDVKAFLSGAARYGLKAIIGIPLAGAKVANWRQRLAGFSKLIISLKDNPTIIGWYPVDEPAAHTWQDNELIEIYNTIKKADPYRLVFVNWAYDGVPSGVGQEPRGTLGSSDIYSTDYYPFAGQRRNMDGYTSNAVRTLETARIHRKVAHSWIQIYGGMDAWREPTSDELNYMVYVNLTYGGMISYWDTKSNSSAAWERLSEINHEAKILAEELFLDPEAQEIVPPVAKGNFLYSAWKKRARAFLLVTHNGNGTEEFVIDPSVLLGRSTLNVVELFKNEGVVLSKGLIKEAFDPFESNVYTLEID